MRIEDVYINELVKIDNSKKKDKSPIQSGNDKVEHRIIEVISNVVNRMRA
jgi:hypothetical protein